MTQDVVEVSLRGGLVHLDSQGERNFSPDEVFALASRLVDVGVQASDACPLKALMDRVIVRVIEEADRKSMGGVHIPDTAQPDANRGVVLDVGPGRSWWVGGDRHNEPIVGIKVGDVVTFSRHAGYEVKIGDLPFRVCFARDILAIVEG
jgi:chaperonin GroES